MGLSNTKSMGESSVIECVRSDPIRAYASWTIGRLEARRTNVVISSGELLVIIKTNFKSKF